MPLEISKISHPIPWTNFRIPEHVTYRNIRIRLSEKINDNFKTACVAEFLAMMFFVTLCGGAAMVTLDPNNKTYENLLIIAASFGFAIMCLAQIVGPLSGGHINSAVSLGLFIGGRASLYRTVAYTLSSMVGSMVGAFWLWAIFGSNFPGPAGAFASNYWNANKYNNGQVFFAEFLCTMTLMYCVYATIDIPKEVDESIREFSLYFLKIFYNLLIGWWCIRCLSYRYGCFYISFVSNTYRWMFHKPNTFFWSIYRCYHSGNTRSLSRSTMDVLGCSKCRCNCCSNHLR